MKLAYAAWAGRVPPLSMQLLVFMALISKDSDADPWFGQGHGALAEHALGRQAPIEEKDIRAVERAIAPLLKEGAICADRRPAPRSGGPRTVRYRLVLPRGDAPRIPVDEQSDVPRNPAGDRPTVSGGDVPRNSAERPTESDETSHGNRGTEEKEEPGGENGGVSQSARAREAERWLREKIGLTDAEATTVWESVQARAAGPIQNPVPYLKSMWQDRETGEPKGDLADIILAVQGASKARALTVVPERTPAPSPVPAPASPVQSPILASVKEPAAVDEQGLPAVEERASLRERLAEINSARHADRRKQAT